MTRPAKPDPAAVVRARLDVARLATERRAALHDLERVARGIGRADYQVIGLLGGRVVVGRQVEGRQTCSPRLHAAASILVATGTVLHRREPERSIVATIDGWDIATTLTLMRAMDHITSARHGDVQISIPADAETGQATD